jgi:hypothetical protein
MKLYLISQDENNGWDTYDSAVVAALWEGDARSISPSRCYKWSISENCWMFQYADGTERPEKDHDTWASSPDKVTAIYLGEAKDGTEAGVICASFNAG